MCDTKWDCPTGHDENICSKRNSCDSLFKCKGPHQTCIHLGNLCDGEKNCPSGDDEALCEMKGFVCPSMCVCLALAIMCSKHATTFKSYPAFKSCPFLAATFQFLPEIQVLRNCHKLSVLKISSGNITDICDTIHIQGLKYLEIRQNLLTILKKHCIQNLPQAIVIEFNENHLQSIEAKAFCHLAALKYIHLAQNYLTHLERNFLFNLSLMTGLSLLNNTLELSDNLAFQDMNLTIILTTKYHICCMTPKDTICSAQRSWYMSCSDLLSTIPLKCVCITMSALIFVLNVLSMVTAGYTQKSNLSFLAIITGLNISDLVYGVYLSIIWVVDAVLKNTFYIWEKWWRSNVCCFVAFEISLWFNFLTPMLLINYSASRLMSVLKPFATQNKSVSFSLKCVTSCAFLSFGLSFGLASPVFFTTPSIPSTLCSPFFDPSDSFVIYQIITWFTAAIQFLASITIATEHYLLVRHLKKREVNMHKSVSRKNSNTSLTLQLILITVSNILCWVPSSIIFLTSIFLDSYPSRMVVWTTVTATPLNSVVNPAILTITMLRKVYKENKKNPNRSYSLPCFSGN